MKIRRHCSRLINCIYCSRCHAAWNRRNIIDSIAWRSRKNSMGIICQEKWPRKITNSIKSPRGIPFHIYRYKFVVADSGQSFNASLATRRLSSQLIFAFFSFQFWSRARLRAPRSTKLVSISIVVFMFHFIFTYFHVHLSKSGCAHFTAHQSTHHKGIKRTKWKCYCWFSLAATNRHSKLDAVPRPVHCRGRSTITLRIDKCAHEFNIRRKRKRWMDATCGLLNLIGPAAHCVNVTAATTNGHLSFESLTNRLNFPMEI